MFFWQALYRIVSSAARMLLVTRGIIAPTDASVFASFSQHFIKAGLIDSVHQKVVDIARSQDSASLLGNEAAVFALADAIIHLYASMGNSLRFPAEIGKTAAGGTGAPVP